MTNCPICGYHLEAHTCMCDANAQPSSGDITFCFSCSSVLVFNAELILVMASPEQVAELEGDLALMKYLNKIKLALFAEKNRN